jgi:hypothetical protein
MTIAPGACLGPCELTARIDAGGPLPLALVSVGEPQRGLAEAQARTRW